MDGISPKNIGNISRNSMVPSQAKVQGKGKQAEAQAPEDSVSLDNLVKYKKEDLSDSGKLGVIIRAKDAGELEKIKTELAKNPENKIKKDLPIINGFSAELDPGSKGILPIFKEAQNVNVMLDGKISAIEPVEKFDNDAHIMMNVAGKTMGVDKVWDKGFKGQGQTVCVIDTGIAQHPDYKDRIIGFKDLVNGRDGVENAYDDQGHGTHCAGIAVGDGSASDGKYTGVAPEAKLVGVKVLGKYGGGSFSDIIAGVQWAVENKEEYGINVISMSLGGSVYQSFKDDPVAQAVEAAVDKGIVTVVAAGNSGPSSETIGTPAHAPHALTIGALDDRGTVDPSDDKIAYFSSRGPTKVDKLAKPDVLTPGVRITAPKHTGGYTAMSGTSMACPLAAGMAALMKQAVPNVSPGELKGVVMGTADPLKNEDHNQQGAGVFDVAEAVEKLTGMQIESKQTPEQ
ncbi:MAG: S8 family peptidase [Vulcanimicrobiota bacterium]